VLLLTTDRCVCTYVGIEVTVCVQVYYVRFIAVRALCSLSLSLCRQFNAALGETSWTRPGPPLLPVCDCVCVCVCVLYTGHVFTVACAQGWSVAMADGVPYYYRAEDGATQWTPPVADAAGRDSKREGDDSKHDDAVVGTEHDAAPAAASAPAPAPAVDDVAVLGAKDDEHSDNNDNDNGSEHSQTSDTDAPAKPEPLVTHVSVCVCWSV
jgi:hypothetical protein